MATIRQEQLEGMKDEKDPELTKLGKKYVAARDERMGLTKKEVEAKTLLIAKMQEKKKDIYRDYESDLIVELKAGKVKLKVHGVDVEEGEED